MERQFISEEMKRYGYVFSWKKNILLYGAVFLLTILLGKLYQLGDFCQIWLCFGTIAILPFLIRNTFRNRYNQKRISDLNIYMEQFLYSFQKNANIVSTLEDVKKLFEEGDMRDVICEALHYIRNTYTEVHVEEKALLLIEEEYPYSGLHSIHSFALEVEKNGGEYSSAILLLLESRRMWADRNYEILKEKRHLRNRVILSILTTLLLCSMIYILGSRMNLNVAEHPVSQGITLVVLLLDLLIFYLADRKFAQDDAIDDEEDVTEIIESQKRIAKYDERKFFDRLGKKTAIKRVTRQVEKDFPKWLMQMSLLLQSENVQVAIFKSYDDAPEVMKEPLKRLIYELHENPTGMEPYVNFLGEYTLPEVRSAMKMLYSISEGTGGDTTVQIADIVRRNQNLMDRADRLKAEDAMAGMYGLFLAPQITGGLKLIIDMLLLFVIYLSKIGQTGA